MASPLEAEDMGALKAAEERLNNHDWSSGDAPSYDDIKLVMDNYDRLKRKVDDVTEGRTVFIMSDEDRAKPIMQLDDGTFAQWGRWLVSNVERMVSEKDPDGAGGVTTAYRGVLSMIAGAVNMGADHMSYTLNGVTFDGKPKGDWQIIVQREGYQDEELAKAQALIAGYDGESADLEAAQAHIEHVLDNREYPDENDLVPYTVFAYSDGENGVVADYWHVMAVDQHDAWEKTERQAREDWKDGDIITMQGAKVSAEDADNLTEVATFLGHIKPAR